MVLARRASRHSNLISHSTKSSITFSASRPQTFSIKNLASTTMLAMEMRRRQSSLISRRLLPDGDKNRGSEVLDEIDEEELERRRKRMEHLQFRLKFFMTLVTTANQLCSKHYLSCDRLGEAYEKQRKELSTSENKQRGKGGLRGPFFDRNDFKANKQMRISTEARRILRKRPEQRTPKEIDYAVIALRGIQQIADYPVRMQFKIATYSFLESYAPGRIVVRERDPAHAFYFILYGTVIVAVLSSTGDSAQTVVLLQRGDSFGELAIMSKSRRQSTVITKTDCDLLSISAESYENIFMVGGQKTIHDPDHNEFMESLDFLKGWPKQLLQCQHDKFVFCFFKRGTVMVKNSNKSKWIYIIKSGSARVMLVLQRVVPRVNKRSACLTNIARQVYHPIDAFYDSSGIYQPNNIEHNEVPYPRTFPQLIAPQPISDEEGEEDCDAIVHRLQMQRPMTAVGDSYTFISNSATHHNGYHTARHKVNYSWENVHRSKSTLALLDEQSTSNTNKKKTAPNLKMGKKTFLDDMDTGDVVVPTSGTPEFVQVQTLTRGDVFGLQDLFKTEQPGMCILSNGAECLMLDKKFFLEHSPKQLINRLRNQVTYYPAAYEMQEQLQERVNWEKYKKVTVSNTKTEQGKKKELQKGCHHEEALQTNWRNKSALWNSARK